MKKKGILQSFYNFFLEFLHMKDEMTPLVTQQHPNYEGSFSSMDRNIILVVSEMICISIPIGKRCPFDAYDKRFLSA